MKAPFLPDVESPEDVKYIEEDFLNLSINKGGATQEQGTDKKRKDSHFEGFWI